MHEKPNEHKKIIVHENDFDTILINYSLAFSANILYIRDGTLSKLYHSFLGLPQQKNKYNILDLPMIPETLKEI